MGLYFKNKFESLFVNDQDKALDVYMEILGLEKKQDWPAGSSRWLTITPGNHLKDQELLLEPSVDPQSKSFQESLFKKGIPAISLFADNIVEEYRRLKTAGIFFKLPPTKTEQNQTIAIFDDTCGNLIQLVQE